MRLIDENLLIQDLHHGIFDDCDCKNDYEYLGIDDYIRNQPTAFDLESVIEQLKELKTYKLNMADAMSELMKKDKLGNYVCLEDVIEIVKSAANATNGG